MARRNSARGVCPQGVVRVAAAAAALSLPLAVSADVAGGGLRVGFDGSFAPEPSNPLAAGVARPSRLVPVAPPGGSSMLTPEQERAATDESSKFIGAMVQAFLHRQRLQPGELECITEGAKEVGGDLGRVASQLGMILEQVFDTHIPGVPGAATADAGERSGAVGGELEEEEQDATPPTPDPSLNFFYDSFRRRLQGEERLQASPKQEQFANAGSLVPVITPGAMGAIPVIAELGYNMQEIVKETHELVGKCVHSDARAAFKLAGEHMRNLDYMAGHFLANGADIVQEFADSVLAYRERNATRFGTDVGIALRKAFLSGAAEGKLPEGLPGDAELANVTAGLLEGFFRAGTEMDIRFARRPQHNLRVDMHRCVAKNLRFFQQVWATTMYLFAQKAVGLDDARVGAHHSDGGTLEFGTMLAFTMLELPGAMEKCDISVTEKEMIVDSLKAMGAGMHVKLLLPLEEVSKGEIMEGFAQTVEDWSQHRWYELGRDLGHVLRKAVVVRFPQKYAIDPDGALVRLPQAPAIGGGVGAWLPGLASAVLLAVGLVAIRRRWELLAARRHGHRGWDPEDVGSSDEAPFVVE